MMLTIKMVFTFGYLLLWMLF